MMTLAEMNEISIKRLFSLCNIVSGCHKIKINSFLKWFQIL